MSINVTVSGNPISIGRMVTPSPNSAKKEFEKRRLMRLNQVRQQSNKIAEDVRNRVRQEKRKRIEKIEEEGQKKLKQWQTRKLLELQDQYRDALKDIGASHKRAMSKEIDSETVTEQRRIKEDRTKHQANSKGSKQAKEEHKKLPPVVTTLETEIGTVDPPEEATNVNINIGTDVTSSKFKGSASDVDVLGSASSFPTTGFTETTSGKDKASFSGTLDSYPQKDTRLSDRIRRRKLMPLPDYCEVAIPDRPLRVEQNVYACSCGRREPPRFKCCDSSNGDLLRDRSKSAGEKDLGRRPAARLQREATFPNGGELATKPKVTLRSVGREPRAASMVASVEKIADDQLVVSSQESLHKSSEERMRKYDSEAAIRGRVALERERLARDYDELLKALPTLQKLERLDGTHRPEWHMTDERLLERERARQAVLDNEFERLFPERTPAVVTIPPKRGTSEDTEPTLNLAAANSKKLYTEDEVKRLLEGRVPSENRLKTEELRDILQRLRRQKEELLREIENAPSSEQEDYSNDSDSEEISQMDKLSDNSSTKSKPIKKKTSETKTAKKTTEKSLKHTKNRESTVKAVKAPKITIVKNQGVQVSKETDEEEPKKAEPEKKIVVKDIPEPTKSVERNEPESRVPVETPKVCEIVIKIKDSKSSKVSINPTPRPQKTPKSTSSSWHEKLAKNQSVNSTSSTSYMSPPVFAKKTVAFDAPIGPKPQQHNFDFGMYEEIKRLLNMSRLSVDELGVSSVSTVTTPSQSVIEIESNRLTKLTENVDKTVDQLMLDDESTGRYPQILEKYASIAEKCSRRISNLTAMIEKVREEKKRMLGDDGTREKVKDSSVDVDYFLGIDTSLTDKPTEANEEKSEEDDIARRLRQLREPPAKPAEQPDNAMDFLPILVNIPRAPSTTATDHPPIKVVPKSKRPPPSKGIRKLTSEFAAPHELSTIPELDSQARLEKDDSKASSNGSLRKDVTKANETSVTSNASSSDERLEMKKVEAMLRSIGMDWAIATLRKTQESLALTSSSSSVDARTLPTSTESGKTRAQKFSSSTLRSDASPLSFINTTDISDIPNVTLGRNTSTPVNFVSLTESTL